MAKLSTNELVDHFFRHESGRLVAGLTKLFGVRNFDLVEDMVQASLAEALTHWKTKGPPENPAAWLHRVAKNRILDAIRRDLGFREKLPEIVRRNESLSSHIDDVLDDSQLDDHLLRMVFACCHPKLRIESAVPLTLKTVCGFSEKEIARGMLQHVTTIRKRIYRARKSICENRIPIEFPLLHQLPERLKSVHKVLYLMFNEGYSSTEHMDPVRADVCEESARLCHLLTMNPKCNTRATFALLSLMLFHASRFEARVDKNFDIVLLEDQDRSSWDRDMIERATEFFSLACQYGLTSSFHWEAAIAMQHCTATSYKDTNWTAIIDAYDVLIKVKDNSVYKLNQAIAIAQRDGPEPALAIVNSIKDDSNIRRSHYVDATLGELYRLKQEPQTAETFYRSAIEKTESATEKTMFRKRIKQCRAEKHPDGSVAPK